MYSTLISAALFASLALTGARAADPLTINTVTLTQCKDAHITWSGGQKSYNLIVVDAAHPCDSVLADLGDHDGTSMTWKNVPLKAGTEVQLSLEDALEDEAWSATITIQGGDDSSCLPGGSSSSSSSDSASPSSTDSASGATLTVNPSVPAGGAETAPTTSKVLPSSSTTLAVAGPVGAAQAGIGSGAASVRASAAVLGVVAAAVVFVL